MRGAGAPGASVAAVSFLFAATGGGLAIALGVAGSVVLAAAMAGRTISGWLSAVWIAASALLLGGMLAFVAGDGRNVSLLALAAPFGLAWLVVGLAVLRRGVPFSAPAPDPSG
jgi:CHASE2 domain-containing sensor protein